MWRRPKCGRSRHTGENRTPSRFVHIGSELGHPHRLWTRASTSAGNSDIHIGWEHRSLCWAATGGRNVAGQGAWVKPDQAVQFGSANQRPRGFGLPAPRGPIACAPIVCAPIVCARTACPRRACLHPTSGAVIVCANIASSPDRQTKRPNRIPYSATKAPAPIQSHTRTCAMPQRVSRVWSQ